MTEIYIVWMAKGAQCVSLRYLAERVELNADAVFGIDQPPSHRDEVYAHFLKPTRPGT
jgi:hypothetical protein